VIQPPGCQRERMPRFKQEGSAIRKGEGKNIQHEKRRSSSNEDQGHPPSPWKHRCHPAPCFPGVAPRKRCESPLLLFYQGVSSSTDIHQGVSSIYSPICTELPCCLSLCK
jgi:hypothetical protein